MTDEPVAEERLRGALDHLATTTTVSDGAWERIEERTAGHRRRVTVWVAAPALVVAAVLLLAVVALGRVERDPSVVAGPAAGPALYAPAGLDGYELQTVSITEPTTAPGDDNPLRVYGHRAPDGTTVDRYFLVITAGSPDGASLLRSVAPGGTRPRCLPGAGCVGLLGTERIIRGQTMFLVFQSENRQVVWDEPGGPTIGVMAFGMTDDDVAGIVKTIRLDGGQGSASVLPDGFTEIHRGVWPPSPGPGAERVTRQEWAHPPGLDTPFSLTVYEGPGVSLESRSWLDRDSKVTEVGGQPALYNMDGLFLSWSPRPGVVLVVAADMVEVEIHRLAESVRAVDQAEWERLVVQATERPGGHRLIATGELPEGRWEVTAYEGDDRAGREVCIEVNIGRSGGGGCDDDLLLGRLATGNPQLISPSGVADQFVAVPVGRDVAAGRLELTAGPPIAIAVSGKSAELPVSFLVTTFSDGVTPTAVVSLDANGREVSRQPVPRPPVIPPAPTPPPPSAPPGR